MKRGYFITGTDTGVGKTSVTIALMRMFKRQGFCVAGMKPIAAGCQWRQGQWKNEDAVLIQKNASFHLSYEEVNPYAFKRPISPHLAGDGHNVEINGLKHRLKVLQQRAEIVLVEGAGGWFSPLTEQVNNAGLALTLQLPVILVVAIRLGCINQGLLAWQAIQASKADFVGWIAVQIDAEMPMARENIDYLKRQIDAPLLSSIPFVDGQRVDHLVVDLEFCQ